MTDIGHIEKYFSCSRLLTENPGRRSVSAEEVASRNMARSPTIAQLLGQRSYGRRTDRALLATLRRLAATASIASTSGPRIEYRIKTVSVCRHLKIAGRVAISGCL